MTDHLDDNSETVKEPKRRSAIAAAFAPFVPRFFVGLAIILPPLLTIVFFIWAWGIIDSYVFRPVETVLRQSIVWSVQEVQDNQQIQTILREDPVAKLTREDDRRLLVTSQQTFAQVSGGMWIPHSVVQQVDESPGDPSPQNGFRIFITVTCKSVI